MKGCCFLLVVVIGIVLAVPTPKESGEDGRLTRIEENLSLIARYLRQSLMSNEQESTVSIAKAVNSIQSDTVMDEAPTIVKESESLIPSVSLEEPGPLDMTFNFFPDNVYTPDNTIYPETQKPFHGHKWQYMPEKTESRVGFKNSRDAVTCPGAPIECSGNGMCDNGICHCDPKWHLSDCSVLRCFPSCLHGICNNGTCNCENGWKGDTCDQKYCSPSCTENGICVDGVCICNPGFQGIACEEKMCASTCSSPIQGKCNGVYGFCECNEGWGGDDCSLPVYSCVYECYNGGRCNNGTCICQDRYQGVDCSELKHLPNICLGGSVWTEHASPITKTCKNMHELPDSPDPLRSIPKCACPPHRPIWDTLTSQCVEEDFCHVGVCGEFEPPSPDGVTIAIKSKPQCDWSSPIQGMCPGCVDASSPITICFKAGYEVADRIATAKDVVVALFKRDGDNICYGSSSSIKSYITLTEFLNSTSPKIVISNETVVENGNQISTTVSTAITQQAVPVLENVIYYNLTGINRRSVGSIQVSVDCIGQYDARLVIVENTLKTSVFGECGFVAENSSCMGYPACSNHGTCESKFVNSTCTCYPGFFGEDCSAEKLVIANKTITRLGHNITTDIDISEDSSVTTLSDRVIVFVPELNTTYIFWTNGTIEINTNGTISVIQGTIMEGHGCVANSEWYVCSAGCFPTCRNPNPRCTPTCLRGSCQCPPNLPLWDDIQQKCVAQDQCAKQLPCPGIGAVCAGKGICSNGTCICKAGYTGEDCSTNQESIPRVTTRSGTVKAVLPCALPFIFQGKTYNDCTTDFDSDGKEWCSVTKEWEHQWGYCAVPGKCPEVDGIECNGRGQCVNGQCICDPLYSGKDCGSRYMRYVQDTYQVCQLPFLDHNLEERYDCVPGIPIIGDDGSLVGSSISNNNKEASWCLTSFRFEGKSSVGICQSAGQCGNCSNEGGICLTESTGLCTCKPGYSGFFCDHKLTEREILIKLFVATDGDNWSRNSNWGNEGSPCDEPGWTGVTCRQGHIVRLNLDSAGLSGTITQDLASLVYLEVLDLSNNALVGTIPPSLFSSLTSLESITLSGNMLVGSIPSLPSHIVYYDFSQNFLDEEPIAVRAVRVTDGTGTVPQFTECNFPFVYQGKSYTACTLEWSSTGEPWCSTTPIYSGKWGNCADLKYCPGTDGVQCSGKGTCVLGQATAGEGARCECLPGWTGKACDKKVVRTTLTHKIGQVEEYKSAPCNFPFEYNGKLFHDCTTTDSQKGQEWCLVTSQWERKWGFCAPRGTCPGIQYACSGHGTCNDGVCKCDAGWIRSDCSKRQPRTTTGKRLGRGSQCKFPFTLEGKEFYNCTLNSTLSSSSICVSINSNGEEWDECTPVGDCPGTPSCSGSGICSEGECICNPGFQGIDCGDAMSDRDILIKLFRSTGGQRWLDSSKWEQGNHCDWSGISCDSQNNIIAISLANNNLDGTLPEEIGMIRTLKVLDVSSNYLAGFVPVTLAALSSLEVIKITNNQFVGDLPPLHATIECNGNCINSALCSKGVCSFQFS